MKGWKKVLLFLLLFLAGILVGTVIAELAGHVSFLKWLAMGASVGVGYPAPVELNLVVIKLAFGFSVEINLAQIICVLLSLALYKKMSKGL